MPITMKVCNIADYNDSLRKRGRIFHLFDEASRFWLATPAHGVQRSKFTYSDRLIEVTATLRYLFKYPYRQLEGLLKDYLIHKNLDFSVPNFTTLCRRINKLSMDICDNREGKKLNNADELLDVVIDSTGINIYHTGGGHSKTNSRYRKYHHFNQVNKMHVALNPKNKKVLSMKVSPGKVGDASMLPILLSDIPNPIGKVYADGAYDRLIARRACFARGAKQVIPPHINATTHEASKKDPLALWRERNKAVRCMQKCDDREEGRKLWKKQSSYGTRSLVESYFGRFKAIFGFHFMSRNDHSREKELMMKIKILNSFTDLGGAIFKKVA